MTEHFPNMERSFAQFDHVATPSIELHEQLRAVYAKIDMTERPIRRLQSSGPGLRGWSALGRWAAIAAIVLLSLLSVLRINTSQDPIDDLDSIAAPEELIAGPLTVPTGFDLATRSMTASDILASNVPGPAPQNGAYVLQWSVDASADTASQSLLFGPNVYRIEPLGTSGAAAHLIALSTDTGAERWRATISDSQQVIATRYGVVVLVPDWQGGTGLRIALLDHTTGVPIWSSPETYRHTLRYQIAVTSSTILYADSTGYAAGIDLANGMQRWQYTPTTTGGGACMNCTSRVEMSETTLFLFNADQMTITSLDIADGHKIWSVDALAVIQNEDSAMQSLRMASLLGATSAGPLLYANSWTDSNQSTDGMSSSDTVVQLSAKDGSIVWSRDFDGGNSWSALSLGTRVLMVSGDVALVVDADTGEVLVEQQVNADTIDGQKLYLAEADLIIVQSLNGLASVINPDTLVATTTVDVDSCGILYPINPDGSLLCYKTASNSLGYYVPTPISSTPET